MLCCNQVGVKHGTRKLGFGGWYCPQWFGKTLLLDCALEPNKTWALAKQLVAKLTFMPPSPEIVSCFVISKATPVPPPCQCTAITRCMAVTLHRCNVAWLLHLCDCYSPTHSCHIAQLFCFVVWLLCWSTPCCLYTSLHDDCVIWSALPVTRHCMPVTSVVALALPCMRVRCIACLC